MQIRCIAAASRHSSSAKSAGVAVGAARGALDLYEETLRVKRTYQPPHHERFREPEFHAHFGRALGLVATAEAALYPRR